MNMKVLFEGLLQKSEPVKIIKEMEICPVPGVP